MHQTSEPSLELSHSKCFNLVGIRLGPVKKQSLVDVGGHVVQYFKQADGADAREETQVTSDASHECGQRHGLVPLDQGVVRVLDEGVDHCEVVLGVLVEELGHCLIFQHLLMDGLSIVAEVGRPQDVAALHVVVAFEDPGLVGVVAEAQEFGQHQAEVRVLVEVNFFSSVVIL